MKERASAEVPDLDRCQGSVKTGMWQGRERYQALRRADRVTQAAALNLMGSESLEDRRDRD